MTCDPERVTGLVDGELDAETAAAVTAHLEACPSCRAQAEDERALRARLRALPAPELPAGFEGRLRAGIVRPRSAARAWTWVVLPLAAALVAAFGLRGHAPLVAWELARDHDHCFSFHPPPAKVRSAEPRVVAEWFSGQGQRLPSVPARAGDLVLVGARYCPLPDLSLAPHVYYSSASRNASFFVVPHGVRFADRLAGETRGRRVLLLRVEGEVVGIVGETEGDVQALETALRPVLAAWVAALGRASAREWEPVGPRSGPEGPTTP
ncbi:MAG TPA: zf-HC2 domain-containing protein [Vicinamibacteria bacterium]|nr:zf-HC2 domain-containing protein [Vicinamibacteria bacterium]